MRFDYRGNPLCYFCGKSDDWHVNEECPASKKYVSPEDREREEPEGDQP